MTFKTDCKAVPKTDASEPLTENPALFSVSRIEVTIACPYCSKRQPSPSDGAETWDRSDVTATGMGQLVKCRDCGRFYALPTKLFDIIAGL